jgi:hypothetical protein
MIDRADNCPQGGRRKELPTSSPAQSERAVANLYYSPVGNIGDSWCLEE